jgi:arylsulfatase A-like enzyme/tetratricopeptide (TPR) repeat protein
MARRPFRRTLILAGVALGTALSAAGGWRYARASAPLSGPIIIISIDTLRADHLPAYGYQKVKTPAIDLLAANGVVFERAYSHTPQTLPAHTALLSGRLPFETGVRDDVGATVKRGERLLPQLLRERGYSTGAIVSASLLRKDTGIGQGFDFFDDDLPSNPEEPLVSPGERDGGEAEAIAEHWLDTEGTSRAFLFLHLNEPHRPYTPPERFSQYAPYDGEIAYADEIVGRLVHYLKTHQLYDRSTIVLLSDHGEGLDDHGEQEHGLFLYDETIRVPLIIKQESNVGAGRRIPDLVQHVDLVPTILDLVKAPIPDNLHGRSLKPLLEDTGSLREQPVYAEALYAQYHFGWSPLTTMTDGKHQYISAPRAELYDLTRDPGQRENLAAADAVESGSRATELTTTRNALASALERLTASSRTEPLKTTSAAPPTIATTPTAPTAATADSVASDPKDKVEILERYRGALALLAEQKWPEAMAQFQRVVRDEPGASEVWNDLAGTALLLNRYDVALDAYRHIIELEPSQPDGYLGAADVLLKERRFDEARARATDAVDVLADGDSRSRALAHELLARIALARRIPDEAREEAALAQQADPGLPMSDFVEARILYDQGRFEDALPVFQKALAAAAKPGASPIFELHFYTGETLARLDRPTDAEAEYRSALRRFPQNVRARAALATLYQNTGQPEAAETAIAEMLRAVPTAESYALAARLWTSFGNPQKAQAVRAEARRTFTDARTRATTAH